MAIKTRFDPQSWLNPGKRRGWDQREQGLRDAARAATVLASLPRF